MDDQKKKDLDFIKEFFKINITDICSDLKVDKSNLYRGKASSKATSLVREEIVKRYDLIVKKYNSCDEK